MRMVIAAIALALSAMNANTYQRQPGPANKNAAKAQQPANPASQALGFTVPPAAINKQGSVPDQKGSKGDSRQANALWPVFRDHLVDPITWFTFGLLLVGCFQWRAMRHAIEETRASNAATRKSNELAEKALEYGQRSWLIPEVEDSSPLRTKSGWMVVFYIENTGRVPGVMIDAHARVDTDPDFGTAPPQRFSPRGAIVLPGSGKAGALRVTAAVPAEIPEDQLLAPAGGRLCVYCAVSYKDVISDELGTGERETRVSWIRGQDGLWYNNPYFEITLK